MTEKKPIYNITRKIIRKLLKNEVISYDLLRYWRAKTCRLEECDTGECTTSFEYNLYINGVFSQVVIVDALSNINININ